MRTTAQSSFAMPTHFAFVQAFTHISSFVSSSATSSSLIRPFNPQTSKPSTRAFGHVRRPLLTPICMAERGNQPAPDGNDGRGTSGLFGIRLRTNGDVIKFGFAAIAFVYAIKTGLQVAGVPDLLAGQLTTAFVSVFSLLAWISTYFFRVGSKGMTYAQQLRDYENEVIKKRYEELTEEELKALSEELSDEA